MNRRRRTLLLGLGLVALLGVGAGAALLWPTPGDAERMASQLRVGMTVGQVGQVSEYLGGLGSTHSHQRPGRGPR
jgi:hypothetical protein